VDGSAGQDAVMDGLKKLQQQIEEVNTRLAKIESRLGADKK
jgi:hypothetical protein